MIHAIERFFQFDRHRTTFRREVGGGITTFVTMAYIVVVNPKILEVAGIPLGASMVATILTVVLGTLLMGFYARRPFAIAPYMGENAFVAYTVVVLLGFTWQAALGAVFLAGLVFVLLTALRLRRRLVEAVPEGLRYSFAVGIGLFLTFVGLNVTGIVTVGTAGSPVRIGDVTSVPVLVSIAGFVVIVTLLIRKIPGAILVGILATSVLAFAAGVARPPGAWAGLPPSLAPTLFQMDIRRALEWDFFPVVLTIFVMAFADTMGTLIGLSSRAGFLDERGNLPQIERPMMADAISTAAAALLGTTASGAYVESAAGIEAGGRTGFSAVVTAGLFLLTLFFSPLLTAVPPQAYGPALIAVGCLMLAPVKQIDMLDQTELFPAFAVVALMSFTYNIGIGITAGFILYPLFKALAGRTREVGPGLWVLGALSLLFYVFYPYSR